MTKKYKKWADIRREPDMNKRLAQTDCKICGLPASSVTTQLCSQCIDPEAERVEELKQFRLENPHELTPEQIRRIQKENQVRDGRIAQEVRYALPICLAAITVISLLILWFDGRL